MTAGAVTDHLAGEVHAHIHHRHDVRRALAKPQLVEPGARPRQHRKGLGRDFEPERTFIALGDVVERRLRIGQKTDEEIDPAG